jgi:hypothetical protein
MLKYLLVFYKLPMVKMFSDWLTILPPIIVIGVFLIVKKLLGRFKPTDSALELHLTGTAYFTPLPIIRPDLSVPLTLLILVSCLFLCVNLSCYIIVEFKIRKNRKLYERVSLITGACTLVAGLITSFVVL